jgi:hypothetical protein
VAGLRSGQSGPDRQILVQFAAGTAAADEGSAAAHWEECRCAP